MTEKCEAAPSGDAGDKLLSQPADQQTNGSCVEAFHANLEHNEVPSEIRPLRRLRRVVDSRQEAHELLELEAEETSQVLTDD